MLTVSNCYSHKRPMKKKKVANSIDLNSKNRVLPPPPPVSTISYTNWQALLLCKWSNAQIVL